MSLARTKTSISGLYAVIDSTYVDLSEMEATAVQLVEAGVRLVQLRAKGVGAGETLKAARAVQGVCARSGAVFIVNDRVDIAIASGADGVHLGHEDVGPKEARRLLGPDAVIGLSTHNHAQAIEADKAGPDYISFGPIFKTKTKKDAEDPLGVEALAEICSDVSTPIVAIGGITEDNIDEVLGAGPAAVAMISALFCSGDIRAKAASVVSIFQNHLRREGEEDEMPDKVIKTEQYRDEMMGLLEKYDLDPAILEFTDSHSGNRNPLRVSNRYKIKKKIIFQKIIPYAQKEAYIDSLHKGFEGAEEVLRDDRLYVLHQLLHEVHQLTERLFDDYRCDTWAFYHLKQVKGGR